MALDTVIQKTKVYKDLHLKGDEIISITGDSIATRLFLSGGWYIGDSNSRYIQDTSVGGSDLAKITINDPTTWNPYSFIGRSLASAVHVIDLTNIDVLLVWSGFNDYGDDVPLGTIDSNDEFTIAGAIRVGVANYLARKPSLKILFINPNANPYQVPNGIGLNIIDYAAWILAVCQSIDIPCYDMWTYCGITDANKAIALPDTIHPSATWIVDPMIPLINTFLNSNL
jgi:hypothetical protein